MNIELKHNLNNNFKGYILNKFALKWNMFSFNLSVLYFHSHYSLTPFFSFSL